MRKKGDDQKRKETEREKKRKRNGKYRVEGRIMRTENR